MYDLNRRQDAIDKAHDLMLQSLLVFAMEDVVHCKECKHYDGRSCNYVNWWNTEDDFCSRGERETE